MIVETLDDLRPLVGQELGVSDWMIVDQKRIDLFADATNDHQWIHVDPVRAKDGPFGATIAHGYLTLSLVLTLWTQILDVRHVSSKVNYGLGKVRFPAPVPVGSKVRARAGLTSLEDVRGGVQLVVDVVVERDGSDRPVCVAQPILRFYS